MKRIIISAILVVFLFTGVCSAELTNLTADEAVQTLDKSKLRVHFIDVGTGLAMFIQTPDNQKSVFIDGGKEAKDSIIDYVHKFHPKNSAMDLTIVTHADNDHFYGMMRIFDNWDVKEFWNTGYDDPSLTETGYWKKNFIRNRVMAEADCIVKMPVNNWAKPGDFFVLDGLSDIKINFLNTDSQPPEHDPVSNRPFEESLRRNNASLVFKLLYKDISFLITGDINGRDLKSPNDRQHLYECDSEELELVSRHLYQGMAFNLKSNVLQVPHHGSNGSSSMAFLRAVNPEYAVIPAGMEHGHPTDEALFRLKQAGISEEKTFRTDDGETETIQDAILDDTFVFETDGASINNIYRVRF